MFNQAKIFLGRFLLVWFFCVLMNPNSFATPPAEIRLEYDVEQKVLKVDIDHISHNPHKHFIRKIEIYKNDEEPIIKRFAAQKSEGISVEVALEAKEQDKIRVKAVCNQAGTLEGTLIIK